MMFSQTFQNFQILKLFVIISESEITNFLYIVYKNNY
jgi:hypothetical protein